MDIAVHRQMGAHVQITGVWQWLGNGPALLHGSSWICRHIPPRGHCSPTPSYTGHAPWLGERRAAGGHLCQGSVSSASQQAIHHQILTWFHQPATPDISCIALGALALILKSPQGIEGNVFVLSMCREAHLKPARRELQGCQIPTSSFLGMAQLRG